MFSGNHLSYPVTLSDLCYLEKKAKVTRFDLGLLLALVVLCTILVRIREIFIHILSGNHISHAITLK